MPAQEPAEKWYYDACTLDEGLVSLDEIINKSHFHKAYTSNLAIGEACANCFNTNEEQFSAFVDLLRRLRKYIEIVGNDGVEETILEIKELCPRLSLTDSMHLATALREKCCVFRTTDLGFDDVTKDIGKQLANKHGMSTFSIGQMNPTNKKELFRAKREMRRKKSK